MVGENVPNSRSNLRRCKWLLDKVPIWLHKGQYGRGNRMSFERASKDHEKVNSNHPLVGAWVEQGNPHDTTPVVYTTTARAGRFRVSGVDESDGVPLRISNTTWNGEQLRFVSLFPPTKHEASHEFWLTTPGRGRHKIRYSDEDGNHTINEVWKKRA
jgi:hypothetical protein